MADHAEQILTELVEKVESAIGMGRLKKDTSKYMSRIQTAIKTAGEQIKQVEQQHQRLIDELMEADKSLGIENAELKDQLRQQGEQVKKMKDEIFRNLNVSRIIKEGKEKS